MPEIADKFRIAAAQEVDVPLILSFIRELAEYEQLAHEVVATEEGLREQLFGSRPGAEVIIGYYADAPAGFALYFHNFSTFLGKPGVYLEDLYVRPEFRGRGIGRIMLSHVARVGRERGCERLEWSVLNWNAGAIRFYKSLGAVAMDGWTVYRLTGEALGRLSDGT